jgi:hypothetical protein
MPRRLELLGCLFAAEALPEKEDPFVITEKRCVAPRTFVLFIEVL